MENNKYDKILLRLLVNFMKIHDINKLMGNKVHEINNLYRLDILNPFNDLKLKEWKLALLRFTNFDVKYELIKFLTEYDIFDEFMQNMINFKKFNAINELINNDKTSISLLIDAAFIWSETKKGHYFWSDINHLWVKKVKKKYDQIKSRWNDELSN